LEPVITGGRNVTLSIVIILSCDVLSINPSSLNKSRLEDYEGGRTIAPIPTKKCRTNLQTLEENFLLSVSPQHGKDTMRKRRRISA